MHERIDVGDVTSGPALGGDEGTLEGLVGLFQTEVAFYGNHRRQHALRGLPRAAPGQQPGVAGRRDGDAGRGLVPRPSPPGDCSITTPRATPRPCAPAAPMTTSSPSPPSTRRPTGGRRASSRASSRTPSRCSASSRSGRAGRWTSRPSPPSWPSSPPCRGCRSWSASPTPATPPCWPASPPTTRTRSSWKASRARRWRRRSPCCAATRGCTWRPTPWPRPTR